MAEIGGSITATELGARTAKAASFLVFGRVLSGLVAVVMFVAIARLLQPEGYGLYTLAIAVSGFVGSFAIPSLGVYFNRNIPLNLAKKKKHTIRVAVGDGILLILAATAALAAIGALLAAPISKMVFGGMHLFLLDVAFLYVISSSVYMFFYSVLLSFGKGEYVSAMQLTNSIFQGATSIGLILLGFGALGAASGMVLGSIAASIVGIVCLRSQGGASFRIDGMRERMREMLAFTLPLAASGIMGSAISNFSVILLGLLIVPVSLIGQYGVASRISVLVDIISGSLTIFLIPMFTTALHGKKTKGRLSQLYSYSLYYGALFTLPMIAYISILSKYLVEGVFTLAYKNVIVYMPLVSIGLFIGIAWSYAYSLVVSMGDTRQVLKYSMITSAAEMVSLFLLTPILHVMGVIISLLYVGNIASLLLYLHRIRGTGIRSSNRQFPRLVISSILLSVAMLPILASNTRPPAALLLGAAEVFSIYPILVGITGAISRQEISTLRAMVSGIPIAGVAILPFLSYARIFCRR